VAETSPAIASWANATAKRSFLRVAFGRGMGAGCSVARDHTAGITPSKDFGFVSPPATLPPPYRGNNISVINRTSST